MLSNTFRILFQMWEELITNSMINNKESKIENRRLKKCCLKNRFFCKLDILLET